MNVDREYGRIIAKRRQRMLAHLSAKVWWAQFETTQKRRRP